MDDTDDITDTNAAEDLALIRDHLNEVRLLVYLLLGAFLGVIVTGGVLIALQAAG